MDDFPWDQVKSGDLESLRVVLLSSSTSRRTRALNDLREKLGSDLPENARQPLLELLLQTIPRYIDRSSRQAVQQCLRSLLNAPISADDLRFLVSELQADASKASLDAASALVVLEWGSILLQTLKNNTDTPLSLVLDIIALDARALETCLAARPKPAIKHSALSVTRRALRAVFRDTWGDDIIRRSVQLLTSNTTTAQKNAPFIGVIAGVSVRLSGKKEVLEEVKKSVIAYYIKELVGSKSAPPVHIANSMSDFFECFVTEGDLTSDIVPPLEKAILRSPEVVFSGLVPSLFSSLPEEIDLSELLHSRLLKHLLSSMKSNNPAIRQGALQSFKSILYKSKNESLLLKIAGEIIGPLKTQKITSPEQRAIYAQALSAVSPTLDISKDIVQGFVPVFSRESNEPALEQEIKAFAKHLTHLIQSKVKISDDVANAIVKGAADKKIPFRKLWQLNIGEALWQTEPTTLASSEVEPFVTKYLARLKEIYKEVTSNPLPSAQNGALFTAYVYLALSGLLSTLESFDKAAWEEEIIGQSMVLVPKPSFLLNPKAYSKLSSQAEIQWAVRTLAAVPSASKFESADAQVKTAWGEAFIYTITAPGVQTSVRDESSRVLSRVHQNNVSAIGRVITDALWAWILAFRSGEKESAPISAGPESLRFLHLVVKAICPASSSPESSEYSGQTSADIKKQLIDLLLLGRPESIPNVSWIDLCLRTGTDPGNLVRESSDDCIKQIVQVQDHPVQSKVPEVDAAIWAAAGDLAFVAPDAMVPKLVNQIKEDLDVSRAARITPTDAAIARTPEGTMFVDVLNTKSRQTFDKNTKDYDILKWEEEMRAALAQKKGEKPKKLTGDEQAKVKAQLAKESKIREGVLREVKRIERGSGIIQGLAAGPAIDADDWINPALSSLLALSKAGAGLFSGDVISKAYIKCSEKLSTRLGPLRPFVGIATLRAISKGSLPVEMEVEPLGKLVTRILYRLRFASEQRPLDNSSLAYALPLLYTILTHNGVDEEKGEEEGEQVLLALEILAFHSGSFTDTRLPRVEALDQLISSMQKYTQHYKLIKDTLSDVSRSIAANITKDELDALLRGTIVSESSVRLSVLQAIEAEIDLTDLDFSEHIWLAYHDHVEENAEVAEKIWEENALEIDETAYGQLIPYLDSQDSNLRGAAARALAHAVETNSSAFGDIVSQLKSKYEVEIRPKEPEKDKYGMPKKVEAADYWASRSGIALAFKAMQNSFEDDDVVSFLRFLIERGPLIDRSGVVRTQMADSGRAVIAARGQEKVEELMELLETTLETSDKGSETSDLLNEAVVVLYGSLARHLKADDLRLQTVIKRLLATLPTPSESVQSAVSDCLPPLIRLAGAQSGQYVQEMLDQLLQSKKYATQRGAAYGLAGIVKGRGILTLREYRVMSHVQDAAENKKEPHQRLGSLLAYELFATILGRTFEPYVIQVVPQLLASFGDPNMDVRDTCLYTAKACFANLSSYGVKQILPTLLEGLDDTQWRSQKGACDLLGAMAYLDPQQLATSLPEIIPPLTVVLNDSHKEVRNAANRSLQRFGEVISNPEVKSLVSVLLKALSDPTKFTDEALDSLIKVSFVHYLDAPSLALVVRILERGLGDRSATKRKSAQIIGSLAHLTERKDLISHLPIIVSGLNQAIIDPVPTTRATASKALGSLIEKLGEDALPDLIPNLMSTLKSDTGAGDRLGSAQALSEVLAGLGTTRLEETLPTILQNISSSKATVREGFMTLFIYLPACFGNSFAQYLSRIIPPILAGLADDVDTIRETSLRAGRLLVKNFSSKAIDLLLPELERGLADDSYRIRLSSVELVGDLLFSITGITARAEADEEEEEEAAQAGQSLLEVLGEERRDKVLSALFICRCDTSGLVKTAAMGVWKSLVASPKTLKEMVPTLSQLIIRRLGSSNMEQKIIASNALGDLIKKAGENVLSTLLPTLEDGLQTSPDVDVKQGICLALKEIITSSSPDALEDYEKILISTVRVALVDHDEDVREAAADAFDALQQILGKKAIDQVLPHLLLLLRNDEDAEQALSALLTLLTEQTRANIILPNLIPTLLTSPISTFNARALASLAEVAGSAMSRRLPIILNTLMDNIISCKDDEQREELDTAFHTVLISVDEYDGLNVMMSVILALIKHDDHNRRANAANHLKRFFDDADIDFSRYHQDLIRVLLISFDDSAKEVVKAAWTALSGLTSHLRKEEMEVLSVPTRQILRGVGVSGADLPGFSLPKGISAILPIFLQGLLNGSVDQRTQSALAMGDLIDRTAADALKPFVTQITGPLIRVVSERSVDIKCAIFYTLNKLLQKIPLAVKPFLPQLQRTFARGLADQTSETLRNRAAKGLGILITLTPRVDPLIAELITGTKTADVGVRNAMMKALQEVVGKAGTNMSEASKNSILALIDDDASDQTDTVAITNARLLGALVKVLPPATAGPLIKSRVLTSNFSHASILGLNALLVEAPSSLTEQFAAETQNLICQGVTHKDPFISDNSVLAAGKFLLLEEQHSFESNKAIFEALAPCIQPGTPSDTRRLALVVIRTVTRNHPELTRPHLALLAPPIFAGVRDMVIPIKLAAEAAFLSIFSVVDSDTAVFDKYMAGPGTELPPGPKRSMSDYFKRVALRLATQARERREAEGGQGGLGLSNDEIDDEKELWSSGKVDLEDGSFGDE